MEIRVVEHKGQNEGDKRRRKGPETEVEEAWRGKMEYGQWQRAVVCTRLSVADKREMIEESISRKFGFRSVIKPFSDNKAAIICPLTTIWVNKQTGLLRFWRSR